MDWKGRGGFGADAEIMQDSECKMHDDGSQVCILHFAFFISDLPIDKVGKWCYITHGLTR